MVIVSVPAFGFHVYPRLLPAAIVTAILGATALCVIGFAVSTFVRRADTAPAIANLTLFPILFLSGVFFPLQGAPGWVLAVAHVFPLYRIVQAFTACFSPFTQGWGFALRDLAEIVAWGQPASSSQFAGSAGSRRRRKAVRECASLGCGRLPDEADAAIRACRPRARAACSDQARRRG
jgi:ABC-2 type transporter